MKIIERVLGGFIILFMISRLLFIYPFSSVLITFSCLLLSLLYLCFSFALLNNVKFRAILKKESYRGKSVLRILLSIFTGFTLSFLTVFILFKFQRWPYGNVGLLICLIGLAFIIIVVLIKYIVSKNRFYSNFAIRLFVFVIYGSLLYFIPSASILEMKYKNFPDYVKAEKALMKDPQNKYLQQRADEERERMNLSNH